MGGKRFACGVASSLAAMFLFAIVNSSMTLAARAGLDPLSSLEKALLIARWTLYSFVLAAPFVLGLLVFVGIPLLHALGRLGHLTTLGVSVAAMTVAVVGTLVPYLSHPASTCGFACILEHCIGIATLAVLLGGSFSLAARLPLFKAKSTHAA